MLKLNKIQLAEKQKLLDRLTEVKAEADEAIAQFNEKLAEMKEKLVDKIDMLNIAREEAKDFAADIAAEMESYHDEKSDKWQEGESGQSYATWKEAWEEVAEAFDNEAEAELPEDAGELVDTQDAIEAFDSLPGDPQS